MPLGGGGGGCANHFWGGGCAPPRKSVPVTTCNKQCEHNLLTSTYIQYLHFYVERRIELVQIYNRFDLR